MLKQKAALRAGAIFVVCALVVAACTPGVTPPTDTYEPTQAETLLPSPGAATTTPETIPTEPTVSTAAVVNGEPILSSYFQNEVLRYRDSLAGIEPFPTDEEINAAVMEYLIEQALLSQAARAGGFVFSDADMQTRLDGLVSELGSGSALTQWMQVNHYDDAEFRQALRLSAEAAWQRDQVISGIPDAVEQVRARQILTTSQADAAGALNSLAAGGSFDDLAWRYSPDSGGELGWFPRGYLLYPQIEEAAFALPVGQYSQVIATDVGYHIILVMERDEAHPLTTDARVALQAKALADWLAQARSTAIIEITLP